MAAPVPKHFWLLKSKITERLFENVKERNVAALSGIFKGKDDLYVVFEKADLDGFLLKFALLRETENGSIVDVFSKQIVGTGGRPKKVLRWQKSGVIPISALKVMALLIATKGGIKSFAEKLGEVRRAEAATKSINLRDIPLSEIAKEYFSLLLDLEKKIKSLRAVSATRLINIKAIFPLVLNAPLMRIFGRFAFSGSFVKGIIKYENRPNPECKKQLDNDAYEVFGVRGFKVRNTTFIFFPLLITKILRGCFDFDIKQIPPDVFKANNGLKREFLRAVYDEIGYVVVPYREVIFRSRNVAMLKRVCKMLSFFRPHFRKSIVYFAKLKHGFIGEVYSAYIKNWTGDDYASYMKYLKEKGVIERKTLLKVLERLSSMGLKGFQIADLNGHVEDVKKVTYGFIAITKENLEKFASLVGSNLPEKQKKLRETIKALKDGKEEEN